MWYLLIFSTFIFSISTNYSTASTASEKDLSITLEKICSPTECYTVIKELGEGAFGKVYAVKNSKEELFAIKSYKAMSEVKMAAGLFGDPEREYSRGQLLNHPHIIKSYDLFTANSPSQETTTNLVLDFVDGNTLGKIKKGNLSNSNSFKAAIQFIDAMRYALGLDLMHVDLHGENVMLDSDLNLMVIDLASFFSYDELFGFVANESKLKTENEPKHPPSTNKTAPKTAAMKMMSTPAAEEEAVNPVRTEKLRKFFNQNPELFTQLKLIVEENQIVEKSSRIFKSVSKNISAEKDISKNESLSSSIHALRSPMQTYYFDRVTEICISLISKSHLHRQEKIDLRAEIKKIVWNYEEDLSEGNDKPFEIYFDELQQMLQSH